MKDQTQLLLGQQGTDGVMTAWIALSVFVVIVLITLILQNPKD
jgi:hypothetical protein